MKLITIAGAPSSGKTSIILRLADYINELRRQKIGVVKFDCLTSFDQYRYREANMPVCLGLSGKFCPDHFFVNNVIGATEWGEREGLDILVTESAGLCNRCAPHINGILAICVIDNLAGVNTPRKIGPMLKFADIIVITKGDIVSQAEREVFSYNVRQVNQKAIITHVNGITGQGVHTLSKQILNAPDIENISNFRLRFTMPAAVCSYCTGETRIGEEFQMGMMKKMEFFDAIDEDGIAEFGFSEQDATEQSVSFLETEAYETAFEEEINSLVIIGGKNKSGDAEDARITIQKGEIIGIAGPTGSGKSRLLADIECVAQGDTPTGRKILINGKSADDEARTEMAGKIIAQLSQNMNFVMDISVGRFLEMHAKSRLRTNIEKTVEACFRRANDLAGEKFGIDTKVTQLSGGQSRALMIADTAFISVSPIILIDEIENAGIDRKEAVKLLAKNGKIVFISTHDPLLALYANKRIIIHNGGISKILDTTREEKESLAEIEKMDGVLQRLRHNLRTGGRIII